LWACDYGGICVDVALEEGMVAVEVVVVIGYVYVFLERVIVFSGKLDDWE